MKHDLRDPADLKPHSILSAIPAPAKDAPEVHACADAIREQDDHLLPIVIDERNQILTDDSRLRWMAARRMQLTEVPVVVQPGALAPVIALNALVHRAHLTKSAIAYLALPLLQPALDAARAIRGENIKNAKKSPIVSSGDYRAATVDQLAEKLGFGRNLLFQARKVREAFELKQKFTFTVEGGVEDGKQVELTLREFYEPKILRAPMGGEHEQHRPLGLGGVIAGIKSVREMKGQPKPDNGQLYLFETGIETAARRFRYWNELEGYEKVKAREKIQSFVDQMPEELRKEFLDALKTAKKGA